VESADALIAEGLRNNGPLYGLGWHWASLIADENGRRAVGYHQTLGPVAFLWHAVELAEERGEVMLAPEVLDAVDALESLLTE
jgi:hypothetical protein